ncbi:MAG: Gfo/Idh/MocA family oxidoreductase [Planctomycetota bacterium]|nr:Gfo/Idh/MocA family oxidoreductase [Planctomycetota bacterium]
MKRLSIGFVGAGFITNFHIQSLVEVRDCVVGGVTSRTRESADKSAALARELGLGEARGFDTVEEMAADPGIDAIWINSPNDSRIAVMEAIAAGNARREVPLSGVACEKPLARNLVEARKVVEIMEKAGISTGYLENQVFTPSVVRGKEVIWGRAAPLTGRPYLARAAEEHCGPHSPWFWRGEIQGGGVMNDMMCHSVETARFLLTAPGAPRDSLTIVSVNAQIASLKWTRPEYAQQLKDTHGEEVDYINTPSEDFARCTVTYRDQQGHTLIAEATTSWAFVGAGLRLSFELLGPEYSMRSNSLETGLEAFFSRKVVGDSGEDMIEKQNAEQGVMPIVPAEASAYGYAAENRHMVNCFLTGKTPDLTFNDGLEVVRILMAAYLSAETDRSVDPSVTDLEEFRPAVAQGKWRP